MRARQDEAGKDDVAAGRGGVEPQLARVTLAEQTAEILRHRIVWGELPPGSRLIETELADHLGISRTPVRQALQRLEADGLVVRQGWGLTVAPFDLAVAVETLLIRELLEPFAARESAPRLQESDLFRLASILSEMARQLAADTPDAQRGAELNMEFHSALNARCEYRRILEVIQNARDAPSAFRLYSTYTPEDLRRVYSEHVGILDAAVAAASGKPGPDVGELIEEHMRLARLALLRNVPEAEASRSGNGE